MRISSHRSNHRSAPPPASIRMTPRPTTRHSSATAVRQSDMRCNTWRAYAAPNAPSRNGSRVASARSTRGDAPASAFSRASRASRWTGRPRRRRSPARRAGWRAHRCRRRSPGRARARRPRSDDVQGALGRGRADIARGIVEGGRPIEVDGRLVLAHATQATSSGVGSSRHRLGRRLHAHPMSEPLCRQEVQQRRELRGLHRVGAAVRVAVPMEHELDPEALARRRRRPRR